ncbi:MAG: protein kinase, partial [Propionibacteriaceae bacterium]|nr:protein kinase [Propionibacteriaceae bacterium]
MMQTDFLLDGRYQLGERLGKGGMAEVNRARDTRVGKNVAIKRLKQDLAEDSVISQRFQREITAIASISHPNIISISDTGNYFDDIAKVTIPYLVMDLIEGETLRELLDRDGKLTIKRALEITDAILAALAFSHEHGIIHRDIKPGNVMITKTGHVKVLDFGIARIENTDTITATAIVPGTPAYLPPEQAIYGTVDARSDLYSTGCLLYELLAGKPPFDGQNAAQLVLQHTQDIPVPPSTIQANIPAALDQICLKALAKDPAQRYQTAGEMRSALDGIHSTGKATPPPVISNTTELDATESIPYAAPVEPVSHSPKPLLPVNQSKPLLTVPTEEEDKRKRRFGIILILVLLLFLATGGTTLGWLATQNAANANGGI